MGEDDFIYWQDVLDDIAAGRLGKLACPFCQAVGLKVDQKPNGVVHVGCTACKQFIEGRFPAGTSVVEPR